MLDKTKILEEKRRKYIGFLILFFIILFIMFSICGSLIKIDIVSSFYGAIIFLAITFFLSFKINKLFEKEFKEFITEYIHNKFSFEYYPLYIDEKIDNNIFNKTWDFQECQDAIIGVYDNLSFKSYYINLFDEEEDVEIFWGKVYVLLLPYNSYKLALVPNKNKFKFIYLFRNLILSILSLVFLVLSYLLITKLYSSYHVLKFPLIFISVLICLLSLLIAIFFLYLFIKILGYGLEANSEELIKVNTNNKKFDNYFKLYIEKNNKIQDVLNNKIIDKLIEIKEKVGEFYVGVIGNKLYILFPKENIFNYLLTKDIHKFLDKFVNDLEKELYIVKEIVSVLTTYLFK
jgi:hypothetical protein